MRLIVVIITLLPALSVALEPLSTTYLVGYAATAIAGYFYYTYDPCDQNECCKHPWVVSLPYPDFSMAKNWLSRNLHGQPLVEKIVSDAMKKVSSYSRPLLLSFHGPVGTGKTFLSSLISDLVFKKGKESDYVHFFSVGYHFNNPSKIWEYHEMLKVRITESLKKCARSVFIFDEFDKMPPGLDRTIASFLEPRGRIGEVKTGGAIFILLSNTGSKAIVKKSYELYRNGIERKDFKLSDFEDDLKFAVFNEEGAYKGSELINKELVDAYVPFLPLEKEHITACIISEYRNFHNDLPSAEVIENILNDIKFSKQMNNLYAETGCKKVLALVARY